MIISLTAYIQHTTWVRSGHQRWRIFGMSYLLAPRVNFASTDKSCGTEAQREKSKRMLLDSYERRPRHRLGNNRTCKR